MNDSVKRWVTLLVLLLFGCSGQPEHAAGASSTLAAATTTHPLVTASTGMSPATTRDTLPSTTQPAAECDGSLVFEHPPVDLAGVELVVPFGLMSGSHVTPVDHQYFQNYLKPDREIDVFSPASGRVVSIQHFGSPVSENPEGVVDDYRIVIEHTCTVSSIFIHIDDLIPRLAAHDPGIGNHASVDLPVAAGERIGTFTENVDYSIVDLAFTTTGLIDPASYDREPWKIHVPDTFDYFLPEIAEQMAALSIRSGEPRGGVFKHVNLLVPPVDPAADVGFIIMEPCHTPPMSGSNSICVATVVLDSGIFRWRNRKQSS